MKLTEDTFFLYQSIKFKRDAKVLDIGCGDGSILSDYADKYKTIQFYGIDKVKVSARNKENLTVKNIDIKDYKKYFSSHFFDIVLSNPPYFCADEGKISPKEENIMSKTDQYLSIDLLFCSVNYLLHPKGRFYLLYPASRLYEVLTKSEKYSLKIDKIRFRFTVKDRNADIFLFSGENKKGKVDPKILFPYIKEV
jgi:tRNA1(Val) A37 N6-methylase TrmN6